MSKEKKGSTKVYMAVDAKSGDDKNLLKKAVLELISESLSENARDCVYNGIDIYATDVDQKLVVNEIDSKIEDEEIDEDVHLVEAIISVDIKYLKGE